MTTIILAYLSLMIIGMIYSYHAIKVGVKEAKVLPFKPFKPIEFNEIRGKNTGITPEDNHNNWINLAIAIMFWALGAASLVGVFMGYHHQWVVSLVCAVFGTIHFLIYKKIIKNK
jgi:hypothetical protein